MEPEVDHAETEVQPRVQDRGGQACQGTRGIDSASRPENVLRKWVKAFGSDPVQAFPGHGQMKPEQLEIERLRREVNKLKAERDILKKAAAYFAKEAT
jgi:transposase